jgi:signal peptidase
MFHVEAGENWYDRADDRFHGADSCAELRNCPAPRSGFITLGDDNTEYDQANGLAEPVASEWILGVARARVPYLGYTRLITTGEAEVSDLVGTAVVSGADDPIAGPTCVLETDGHRLSQTAAEAERADRPDLGTARSLAGSREASVTTPPTAAA